LFNFKQDLQDYVGQQPKEKKIGESPGSQISFQDDLQQYRQLDTSPIKAKELEYEQHVKNAPEVLVEIPGVEIDYSGVDLSRGDIRSVPEGTVGGQCGVFAQSVTKLPDGSNWRVGDTIQEKTNSVAKYRNLGLAFYPGENLPKPGNTVILNTGSKWGHVAVINSINPDGTMTLTESNLNWDGRVTHTRTVPINNNSIVGFIRTQ
jgi:hypothetical protein